MRIVHYLNQFFGGIGGEDKADSHLVTLEGAVGPGRALEAKLPEGVEITATLVCGDNAAQSQSEWVCADVVEQLRELGADVLVCGPAFESGRYGLACGTVASAASKSGVPAVVAMHPENPGVGLCPADVPIVAAGQTAVDMLPTLARVVPVAMRLAAGESLSDDERGLCVLRDIRKNRFARERAASRAVRVLLEKIRGESFGTEVRAPRFPPVAPASPVDVEEAKVGLITTGGLVPHGNPDRLEASSATRWLAYSIASRQTLTAEEFECIHAGIDTSSVNADPNRLVPLDVLSDLKSHGMVGQVDDQLYVTVGNLTPVARAEQFATEIAARLKSRGIEAAILTST